MTDDALTFDAAIAKVQTLVDNGLRVTLDLPEQAIDAAAVLMAIKRQGLAIKVTVKIDDCKAIGNNAISEGPKRKSQWTPRQE
jgi:hypothetical protein